MSSATSEAPAPVLAYDGRVGDLYRIFLVNLVLTILTLGIWRFWGITRMRRYIWSRTRFSGGRFEYDGTGAQLFVGFLLALLVIFALVAVAGLLSMALASVSQPLGALPIAVMEFCIVVLALGARFSAQRYRLSHTLWRGIRGGMTGSMIGYGLRSVLYAVLGVLTLFQLIPWISVRLLERRINASFLGNMRFAASFRAGGLYLRFLATILASVVLAAVAFGSVFLLEHGTMAMLAQWQGAFADTEAGKALEARLGFEIVGAGLVVWFGVMLISASYAAAFYRHITGHTTLGDLHFASEVGGGAILRLYVGNVLILVFTLGLGMPFVIHRNARFFTRNLLATGKLDLAELRKGEQGVSRFGEGMYQALDAGVGVV